MNIHGSYNNVPNAPLYPTSAQRGPTPVTVDKVGSSSLYHFSEAQKAQIYVEAENKLHDLQLNEMDKIFFLDQIILYPDIPSENLAICHALSQNLFLPGMEAQLKLFKEFCCFERCVLRSEQELSNDQRFCAIFDNAMQEIQNSAICHLIASAQTAIEHLFTLDQPLVLKKGLLSQFLIHPQSIQDETVRKIFNENFVHLHLSGLEGAKNAIVAMAQSLYHWEQKKIEVHAKGDVEREQMLTKELEHLRKVVNFGKRAIKNLWLSNNYSWEFKVRTIDKYLYHPEKEVHSAIQLIFNKNFAWIHRPEFANEKNELEAFSQVYRDLAQKIEQAAFVLHQTSFAIEPLPTDLLTPEIREAFNTLKLEG